MAGRKAQEGMYSTCAFVGWYAETARAVEGGAQVGAPSRRYSCSTCMVTVLAGAWARGVVESGARYLVELSTTSCGRETIAGRLRLDRAANRARVPARVVPDVDRQGSDGPPSHPLDGLGAIDATTSSRMSCSASSARPRLLSDRQPSGISQARRPRCRPLREKVRGRPGADDPARRLPARSYRSAQVRTTVCRPQAGERRVEPIPSAPQTIRARAPAGPLRSSAGPLANQHGPTHPLYTGGYVARHDGPRKIPSELHRPRSVPPSRIAG